MLKKDIEISLDRTRFGRDEEIRGTVRVGYPGRYDGVVINAQILGSNGLVAYRSCNGKKIPRSVSRLFIDRDSMPGGAAEFTATVCPESEGEHEVKFRASIIEQHKEIESAVLFAAFS